MRRLIATLVCAVCFGAAAVAHAGLAEVSSSCGKSDCQDYTSYTADPGETNDIRVSGTTRETTFEDRTAPVRAGSRCTVMSEHTVVCRQTNFVGNRPGANGGDGNDRLEDLTDFGMSLSGGPGDDLLLGGPSYNSLMGGGGRDRMHSGGGHDTFVDQDVADYLKTDRPDSDLMEGTAAGSDTVSYQDRTRGVVVDLLNPEHAGEPGEDDRLVSVEHVSGGGGDDRIAGDEGPNVIFNGGGSDRVRGRGGNDRIDVYGGADRVDGGPGDDTIATEDSLLDPRDHKPTRITCGPGNDSVAGLWPTDVVAEDCEAAATSETRGVRLRLPLTGPRSTFAVIGRDSCFSKREAVILSAHVSDRRAPAGGLVGRAAGRCSPRSKRIRELRLALSSAGADYLRRVKNARVQIRIEERFQNATANTRSGFTTTLRMPGG